MPLHVPPTTGFADLTAQTGVLFGGDYNPEQWPRETWREDIELMVSAGVNLVTVGVFSWAMIEPRPGAREFDWLDEVLGLLHAAGIRVDLATPIASPPPWLGVNHPETLPVDADGVRLVAGSRNQFTPASRVYREHALAITRALAERYAHHPAVAMWHVGNEFGQIDHGDEAAREFRLWLQRVYGTIDALNTAWGTTFWSQRYDSFEEILPPRRMPYLVNPTQSLDFRRYSSDQLLAVHREQYEAIRAAGATAPITTNFMGFFAHVDYRSWTDSVDVIADDQYPDPARPTAASDMALVQDLMRSLGDGRPWMLMEQAVSAVSWREHNLPKSADAARRDSLQAVARGADAVCYFQWRQARAGAERFHSSMLPHAGADTDVFRGVQRQGADLKKLRPVVGAGVETDVAIVFDWPSWWAGEEPARPTTRLDTLEQLGRWYRPLWRRGVSVTVAGEGDDLSRFRVILLPQSYIVTPRLADALTAAAARGAHIVVGPFSGVADAKAQVLTGRSPALLRDLLGASGEEWAGLPDDGAPLSGGGTASILADRLRSDGAETVLSFTGGALAGRPAVTRHRTAWHVGTVLDDDSLARVLAAVLAGAGVTGALGSAAELPDGVEAVRRGDVLFLLNHADIPHTVPVGAGLHDLLTGEDIDDVAALAPDAVRALIERHHS